MQADWKRKTPITKSSGDPGRSPSRQSLRSPSMSLRLAILLGYSTESGLSNYGLITGSPDFKVDARARRGFMLTMVECNTKIEDKQIMLRNDRSFFSPAARGQYTCIRLYALTRSESLDLGLVSRADECKVVNICFMDFVIGKSQGGWSVPAQTTSVKAPSPRVDYHPKAMPRRTTLAFCSEVWSNLPGLRLHVLQALLSVLSPCFVREVDSRRPIVEYVISSIGNNQESECSNFTDG
nr:hypothetical protein Itr_chr06CG18530 [Ipomoea trifida]